ncbi:MAG: flagellar biosynthesis anti-sigma factor FlgM [Fibrobacterota bacterium]
MRIQSIVSQFNVDAVKKIDQGRKAASASKAPRATDSSSISSDAQRLSATASDINTVKTQAAAQPEIRAERVQEVKERIKSGYYNSEQFIDSLAEKIMKDFGIS